MKRLFILTAFVMMLLPIAGFKASAKDDPRMTRLETAITEFKKKDGFDHTRLGSVATATIRTMMKASSKSNDERTKQTLKFFDQVKTLEYVDYKKGSKQNQTAFDTRLKGVLSSFQMLLEAKEPDQKMSVYALTDGKSSQIDDVILYVPSDHTIIILSGKLDLQLLNQLVGK